MDLISANFVASAAAAHAEDSQTSAQESKNKICNAAAGPSRADTQTTVNCREQAFSQVTRLLVITRFIANYPIGSPVSGLPTIRSELTAASTADQVHACQMMTEVHTVSIVAKNTYAG
jgi:hypothetical protein